MEGFQLISRSRLDFSQVHQDLFDTPYIFPQNIVDFTLSTKKLKDRFLTESVDFQFTVLDIVYGNVIY